MSDQFFNRRVSIGRREDDENLCLAHHESILAFEGYVSNLSKQDEEQNKYMKQLDSRISSVDSKVEKVDRKVDDLRKDMPAIVGESLIQITKLKVSTVLSKALNWLWKAILAGLAVGVGWLVIELFKNTGIVEHIITTFIGV